MAFRYPLPLTLLLIAACYEHDFQSTDTASPPEADTDTDTDTDGDTGNDLEPTTPQDLCEAVFALCDDGWGWADRDSCTESWLGEGQDWACVDIPAYLSCAAPCTQATDCEGFGACEVPCWDAHCL